MTARQPASGSSRKSRRQSGPTEAPARSSLPSRKTATEPRRRRPAAVADPTSTVTPSAVETREVSTYAAAGRALSRDELDLAILRFLRRFPNETVDLGPLAEELGVDPFKMQLAVEDLHRRRLVVAPFIEPGTAGGATLSQVGLQWLIEREGGKPADVPVALQLAKEQVRAADEAARLPRAQVYGIKRG